MPVIAVMNPKGGVGKSTLATHIAGLYASQGHEVMLGDVDRQQSSKAWLGLRPQSVAPIRTWDLSLGLARPPRGVTHVVLDTPAQMPDRKQSEVLRVVDKILVPLQPSIFDILATREFLDALRTQMPRAGQFEARTRAAEQLRLFVDQLGVPVVGYLRDTQNYVQLCAHGLTLFDLPEYRFEQDRATWAGLTTWLQS
jgi:chromosome partitioning protein